MENYQEKFKSNSQSPAIEQIDTLQQKKKQSKTVREQFESVQHYPDPKLLDISRKKFVVSQVTIQPHNVHSQQSYIASTEKLVGLSNAGLSVAETPQEYNFDERIKSDLRNQHLTQDLRTKNTRDILNKQTITPGPVKNLKFQDQSKPQEISDQQRSEFSQVQSVEAKYLNMKFLPKKAMIDQIGAEIFQSRSGYLSKEIQGPQQNADYDSRDSRYSSVPMKQQAELKSFKEILRQSSFHNQTASLPKLSMKEPTLGSSRHSELFFKVGHKEMFRAQLPQSYSNVFSGESNNDDSKQMLHDNHYLQTIQDSQYGIASNQLQNLIKKQKLNTVQSKIQIAIRTQQQTATTASLNNERMMQAMNRAFQTQGIYEGLNQKSSVKSILNQVQFDPYDQYSSGSFYVQNLKRDRSKSIEALKVPSRKQQVNIQLKSLQKLKTSSQRKIQTMQRNLPIIQMLKDEASIQAESIQTQTTQNSVIRLNSKQKRNSPDSKYIQSSRKVAQSNQKMQETAQDSENIFLNKDVIEDDQEQRYLKFKQKIKRKIEEDNAVSHSEESDGSNEGLIGFDYSKEEDFKAYKKSLKAQSEETVSLVEIAKKDPEKRQNDERDHLVLYLMFACPFFESYSRDLVTSICEKLHCKQFKTGQQIMEKGAEGDCMFIILKGECGVYIEDINKNNISAITPTAVIGPNQVMGEKALEASSYTHGHRMANIFALQDIMTLVIQRKDYQNIIYQNKVIEKMRRLHFLQKLSFFQNFPPVKLIDINSAMEDFSFRIGETVYEIGSRANTFYIVVEGKLSMETVIEIDNFFRFPVNKSQWEVRKRTRRIQYKLQELNKGAIFGHEEMLNNFERRSRVRALTNCKLIYINSEDLFRTFPQVQVDNLRKMMRNLDLDFIVNKIQNQYKSKKLINNAILDAAGVNDHDFSGDRNNFIGNQKQKSIVRLQPWLEKARNKMTKNQHILHQLRKVKLLSKSEAKVGVFTLSDLNNQPDFKIPQARFYGSVRQEEDLAEAVLQNLNTEDDHLPRICKSRTKENRLIDIIEFDGFKRGYVKELGPTDESNQDSQNSPDQFKQEEKFL